MKLTKNIMVFSIIGLIIGASFITTISGDYGETEKSKTFSKISYKVAIRSVSENSSNECKVFHNISEEELLNFKEKFLSIKDNDQLSTESFVEKQFEILKEYNILPIEITVKNITNLINKNTVQFSKQKLKKQSEDEPDPSFFPYVRFGPTINIYASFMSQYSFINDVTQQIPFYFNITKINTILERFFNIENPIFLLSENITAGYYGTLSPWQIGIGGSIGYFSSLGPTEKWNYHFYGPFLGVFILPITILGIYIFYEVDDPQYPGGSFEIPIFDFYINCPIIFSLTIPGWFVNPDDQP
ncbi:MAG: hypothetical protein DRN27_04670 [Thermoplasmata archaeon]|nr:MAG: hypothetical protein DRN27_04670 [Thermoplasmata archaeon]